MKFVHKKASNWDFQKEVEINTMAQLKKFILAGVGQVIIERDQFNEELYGNEWVIQDYDGPVE